MTLVGMEGLPGANAHEGPTTSLRVQIQSTPSTRIDPAVNLCHAGWAMSVGEGDDAGAQENEDNSVDGGRSVDVSVERLKEIREQAESLVKVLIRVQEVPPDVMSMRVSFPGASGDDHDVAKKLDASSFGYIWNVGETGIPINVVQDRAAEIHGYARSLTGNVRRVREAPPDVTSMRINFYGATSDDRDVTKKLLGLPYRFAWNSSSKGKGPEFLEVSAALEGKAVLPPPSQIPNRRPTRAADRAARARTARVILHITILASPIAIAAAPVVGALAGVGSSSMLYLSLLTTMAVVFLGISTNVLNLFLDAIGTPPLLKFAIMIVAESLAAANLFPAAQGLAMSKAYDPGTVQPSQVHYHHHGCSGGPR